MATYPGRVAESCDQKRKTRCCITRPVPPRLKMIREAKEIECPSCGERGTCTPSIRGPLPKRCDACRHPGERPTECEVCNVDLRPPTGPGRPRKTCSAECARALRAIRDQSPERILKRWEYSIKRARREAGRPEVLDCKVCGKPVDSGVRGPDGSLESGFATHVAPGTDPSGEYKSCEERYHHMRVAQAKQVASRA